MVDRGAGERGGAGPEEEKEDAAEAIVEDAAPKVDPECYLCAMSLTGDQLRCAKCKRATYCGRSCQKKHWQGGHREECTANPMVHIPKADYDAYVNSLGNNLDAHVHLCTVSRHDPELQALVAGCGYSIGPENEIIRVHEILQALVAFDEDSIDNLAKLFQDPSHVEQPW